MKAKASTRKIGVALAIDPDKVKSLTDDELKTRFNKRVFPAIIRRIQRQKASDPWHQWSYGFF